jgi:hypothetical protein
MSKLLEETSASREADLKDALHTFFANVREGKPKPALHGAKRLQDKRYRVKFWSQKDWTAEAETENPHELFTEPPPPKTSKAEYIILKALGELRYPPKTTAEESKCFYNEMAVTRWATRVSRLRKILWDALAYVRSNP